MNPNDQDPTPDIFEEFEFRPINEGLGFHKQAPKKPPLVIEPQIKSQILESKVAEKSPTIDSLSSATVDVPTLKPALPRKKDLEPTNTEISLPSLGSKDSSQPLLGLKDASQPLLGFKTDRKLDRPVKRKTVLVEKTMNYSLSALLLDGMLLTAAFLTCLIILLSVTRIDLVASLANPAAAPTLYASLTVLFMGLAWLYLVIHRLTLGATTGEWVFDMKLGRQEQQGSASFLAKAVARSTIVVASGLFLLPLASLLLGKDLLGRWLGVELHGLEPELREEY